MDGVMVVQFIQISVHQTYYSKIRTRISFFSSRMKISNAAIDVLCIPLNPTNKIQTVMRDKGQRGGKGCPNTYRKTKERTVQDASGKSGQFSNACIYPCNGRNRLSKVPLETYRSHEDFDVFHVSIGHSELILEHFEIFLKIYPERHGLSPYLRH